MDKKHLYFQFFFRMKRIGLYLCIFLCSTAAWAQINTNRLLDNGKSALYFDDFVLAIQYFNQVIIQKPHLPDAFYFRAIAKIQLEDFTGATADCSEAIKLNPFMPAVYYARGFAYKRLGEYTQAISDFSKALEFTPNNEHYLINRIEAYQKIKHFDKALEDIALLQTKKSSYKNLLWIEKGSIFLQQGDTTKAMHAINTAVKTDSTNPDSWGARALVYLLKNDNNSALTDYNKAIAYKSKNIGHYINRGILHYRNKNYTGALSDYDKAITIDSTNSQALFNRGILRTEVGDLNNAILDFSRILTIDNKNDEARYQRAIVSLQIKDYKRAKQDFNRLIDSYPNFPPAYVGRAEANAGMGNIRQATIDRYHAQKMMEQKTPVNQQTDKHIATTEQIAENRPSILDKVSEFDNSADKQNQYNDQLRGTIQNNHTQLKISKCYNLTYYAPNHSLRKLNKDDLVIEKYKQEYKSQLVICNQEAPLTDALIAHHFDKISALSQSIAIQTNNKQLYFERGINYALVQNNEAALDDFTHAISIDSSFFLAQFSKVAMQYKLLKYKEYELEEKSPTPAKKRYKLVIDAYTRVITMEPDFIYGWFNRANVLFALKEYKQAIDDYTQAIHINENFAEAYYNRALAYLFIDNKTNGIADLSKAGELGMYQAYNLIKRFQE